MVSQYTTYVLLTPIAGLHKGWVPTTSYKGGRVASRFGRFTTRSSIILTTTNNFAGNVTRQDYKYDRCRMTAGTTGRKTVGMTKATVMGIKLPLRKMVHVSISLC